MMRGGVIGAHIALVPAAVACAVIDAVPGLVSCLVLWALTVVFLATGQWIQLIAVAIGGSPGLGMVLTSFVGRVALLAGVLGALATRPSVVHDASPAGVVVGTLAGIIGWVAGLVWVDARGRELLYDPPPHQPLERSRRHDDRSM